MNSAQAFALAVQHHEAGRIVEAAQLYRQILAADPRHADALHLLGIATHQAGASVEAVALIEQAMALDPQRPAFHANLGEIHRKLGDCDRAIACLRRAIELEPSYADARFKLGSALHDAGRSEEAIVELREALRLRPDFAQAHNNLGNSLKALGRNAEAIAAYREALRFQPSLAETHVNLAAALHAAGRHEEAIVVYRHALELAPESPVVWLALGVVLDEVARVEGAVAAYRRAIEFAPDYAEAWCNLGGALSVLGRPGEAAAACRRALELRPEHAISHCNLAVALVQQGCTREGLVEFRCALAVEPNAKIHSNLLVDLHYLGDVDAETVFREHGEWNELHARPLATLAKPHGNDRDPARTLRVGYVSADFREHSVAFFVESLLAHHDPAEVEVFCYANHRVPDTGTVRLRKHVRHWREVADLSDVQCAELIGADRIDILVDLSGHTADHRLLVFARKPAPVQVTWLGYGDTTGMHAMDYRITDAHADPPGATEHLHSERLVRLPQCAWCYRPPHDAPPVAARHAGGVTFGSFNVLPKITDEWLACWGDVLRVVPDARLLLKCGALGDAAVRERVQARLAQAGIDSARAEVLGPLPTIAEHLAAYSRVDIALDPFPYHGTTTTCEALWMGVPVVTLAGQTPVSRVGLSLLCNAGLPELVAASAEEYVRIAAGLARDVPRLAALRVSMRDRLKASPLLDAGRFARDMEAAYREMWRAWCAKR